MYKRRIIVSIGLIMILTLSVLVASNQPPKNVFEELEQPRFVIASWDYPDEHGQGIDNLKFYENSTGSWVAAPFYIDGSPYYTLNYYNDDYTLNWSAGVAMKIRVSALFNQTLVGVGSASEGQNYLRHDVTVSSAGQEVFSQQNFTYYDVIENGNYYYKYEVILDFIPLEFTTYVVDLTYEVYFEGTESGGPYLHDCSNTDGIVYDSNFGLGGGDYGIGSDGDVVEIWITPDSVVDEKVIYKLEFTNIDNSNGDVTLTTRFRVEDSFIGVRLDLYYVDATSDSTGIRTSQTWENRSITADIDKTLDYALLYCDDYPNSASSGNRSVYFDFVEITNPTGSLTYVVDKWNEVTTTTLIFETEMRTEVEWGMNTALIIPGLVMVPVSTIYLAYGVKHDRSSDRLFYGLIIFFLGCGLFIGGVLP